MRFLFLVGLLASLASLARAGAIPANASIARVWDEEILSAIRIDLPNPPVHARNLYHLSVAMYDVWAAYDATSVGYLYRAKHTAPDVAAARREAISYAAYRILKERYAFSRNATNTLPALDARLAALGYDKDNLSQDPSTPAGLGNLIAATVSEYFYNDGALQARGYADMPPEQGGYVSVNPPLVTGTAGTLAFDVNHWQPLIITNAVSQNNIPIDQVQKFVGAAWKGVRPFSLERDDTNTVWIDPGPPPHLGEGNDGPFRDNVVGVLRASSELTTADGVTADISPGVLGNNSLGANDGQGRPLNPVTGQPYASNVVLRGDFARVLAEFWADGPNSETPPGHWNTLANGVSDDPTFSKRVGGAGRVLDDLEWHVKLYFALNAAVHDAACAAWSLKRQYDGWRPIEAVRYMAVRGQSTDDSLEPYSPLGLPLVPGLIEVVTEESSAPGQRHEGILPGEVVVHAWPPPSPPPVTQPGGAKWFVASKWMPYQKPTFVTPAFPGYVSGHSTFSRSAAEVLTAMTGSPFFPGGLGKFVANAGTFLTTEPGPTQTVELQWATYYDAADQAGLSRIWGGIHPSVDDLTGRRVGSFCGKRVWALAQKYFDGSILQVQPSLGLAQTAIDHYEIRSRTQRGFFYQLQSSSSPLGPYADEPDGLFQAVDSLSKAGTGALGDNRFYRLLVQ
ncbi:MAG TPA: vanadium-dependent haloperoxidase [Candidatus Limnocylindria bacterium]|nr:vanadium-dependent haloperoxidase [Candidatus Limnocylindria bacterium]